MQLKAAELSVDLPNGALGKIIKGKTSNPNSRTLPKLARLFGVTTDWILSGVGEAPTPTGAIPPLPTLTREQRMAGRLPGWDRYERTAMITYAFFIPEEAYLAGREFVLDRMITVVNEKVVAAITAYAYFTLPAEHQRNVATRYMLAKSAAEDERIAHEHGSGTMRAVPGSTSSQPPRPRDPMT